MFQATGGMEHFKEYYGYLDSFISTRVVSSCVNLAEYCKRKHERVDVEAETIESAPLPGVPGNAIKRRKVNYTVQSICVFVKRVWLAKKRVSDWVFIDVQRRFARSVGLLSSSNNKYSHRKEFQPRNYFNFL